MGKQKLRKPHKQTGFTSGRPSPHSALHLQAALALHQQGQLERAEKIYLEILHSQPMQPDALLFLGHLHLQLDRTELAADVLTKAVIANPQHPGAQFNLGLALFRQQRYEEAIIHFDQAILLKPDYAEAFNNRGNAEQNLNRYEASITNFDKAIALQPNDAYAQNNRGISLQRLGRHAEAITNFSKATDLDPRNGVSHNNCGISLLHQGSHAEASEKFRRATELHSDYFDAHINLGIALSCLGGHTEALDSIDHAIALRPDSGLAYNNRGMALMHLGRYGEAVTSFDHCLEITPDHFEALNNRGLALPYLGRQSEALASFRLALEVQPENATAHYNIGMYLLQNGNLVEGWPEFEWRWHTDRYATAKRDIPQTLWLGKESLQGMTILLHAEQGLGDTIQFSRYATLAARLGATVLLEVQPPLKPLLATLEGVSQVIAQGEPLPTFNFHCPLLSLPLAFATGLDTIPSMPRYLVTDSARRAFWHRRLSETVRPRVGLAWAGNVAFGNDHNRSIPLVSLATFKPDNITLVSLQKEIRASDATAFEQRDDIINFSHDLHDFADTAALIDELDLVISVDTAVAHLAGALGKQVWLLLPYNPDWRWLLKHDDSPWYPSARLFRQSQPDDWQSVIETLQKEISLFRLDPAR